RGLRGGGSVEGCKGGRVRQQSCIASVGSKQGVAHFFNWHVSFPTRDVLVAFFEPARDPVGELLCPRPRSPQVLVRVLFRVVVRLVKLLIFECFPLPVFGVVAAHCSSSFRTSRMNVYA